jgi:hypothetical protein
MWRVAPTDLKLPCWYSGRRLSSSMYAVAAVGLLVVGCSAPTDPAPTRSLTSPPATSPRPTQLLAFTSTMAPFTRPAAVSRPTVFAAGDGLLVVGGRTAADRTTQATLRVDLARGTVHRQDGCPSRYTMQPAPW